MNAEMCLYITGSVLSAGDSGVHSRWTQETVFLRWRAL